MPGARSLDQLLVVLPHPVLVLLRRRLLHRVEQLLAELGRAAARLGVGDLDLLAADAVAVVAGLVALLAARLAPGHGDAAALTLAALLRHLLHRLLELLQLLQR